MFTNCSCFVVITLCCASNSTRQIWRKSQRLTQSFEGFQATQHLLKTGVNSRNKTVVVLWPADKIRIREDCRRCGTCSFTCNHNQAVILNLSTKDILQHKNVPCIVEIAATITCWAFISYILAPVDTLKISSSKWPQRLGHLAVSQDGAIWQLHEYVVSWCHNSERYTEKMSGSSAPYLNI